MLSTNFQLPYLNFHTPKRHAEFLEEYPKNIAGRARGSSFPPGVGIFTNARQPNRRALRSQLLGHFRCFSASAFRSGLVSLFFHILKISAGLSPSQILSGYDARRRFECKNEKFSTKKHRRRLSTPCIAALVALAIVCIIRSTFPGER